MRPILFSLLVLFSLTSVFSQVYIDHLNNSCPNPDLLTVCAGTTVSYTGDFEYITYDNFCQDTVRGTTRIYRNSIGEYFIEDFSFGTWETCYGINPPSGSLRLNVECNNIIGISGTDNYGDVWGSSSVTYTGTSIIIEWFNTYSEYGTSELIPLNGRPLVEPTSVLEQEYSFLWNNGKTSQTIETNETGMFSVTVTGPNNYLATASIYVFEDGGTFNPLCTRPLLQVSYFMDDNQNGVQDSSEFTVLGEQPYISLSPEEDHLAFNADNSAYYVIQNKKYNLDTNGSLFSITNLPATIDFEDIDSTYKLHLGLVANEYIQSANMHVSSRQIERCNFRIPFQLVVKNTGTTTYEQTVGVSFDPLNKFLSSDYPTSFVADDYVSWEVSLPNHSEEVVIKFWMEMPDESYVGQLFCVNPIIDGGEKSNLSYCYELRCAVDPNDKHATPFRGNRNLTLFDEELSYTIRFENLGNDTAFNIKVEDKLGSSFDLNTYKFVQSSHPFSKNYIRSDRMLVFEFDDIRLPSIEQDSIENKGFVQFSIKPMANLPEETQLKNAADIYFDFNDAIVTNTTNNTLVSSLGTSSTGGLNSNFEISLVPNPADEYIELQFDRSLLAIQRFSIHDAIGRRLLSSNFSSSVIDISSLQKGYYTLQVISTEGETNFIPFIKN